MPHNTVYGVDAGPAFTTGSYNTAVGKSPLLVNSTGNYNVAVGASALRSYTASGGTAVGYNALELVTTGASNTAIGQSAGSKITTGARNIFIGWAAGWSTSQLASVNDSIVIGYNNHSDADGQIVFGTAQQDHLKMFGVSMARINAAKINLSLGTFAPSPSGSTWTGNANLGLGYNTFAAATTCSSNLGVGHYAFEALTTGVNNAAFGITAGQDWESVADSVAVGNQAGREAVSGVGMTAVGYRSQQKATVARNSSSLGDSALWMSQGSRNVAAGYISAEYMATGDDNVVIGAAAGRNRGNGNRLILIGTSAGGFGSLTWNGSTGVNPDTGSGAAVAGDRVIGIGYGAFEETTGSDLVGLGDSVGRVLTGGSDSVFVGNDAGNHASQKVDPVNQVVIGDGTYGTADNQVVLGNENVVETILRGITRHTTFAVAALPAASTAGAGARAFVVDANSATFNDVVAGGGAIAVPVFSDGTDWRVG